jgi:NAD(P)-dependent dehydrogenase (short-subunit alcohol dehydrogenase family)
MGSLTGKRILVTGAGGLMGGDFARAFAGEGADLVLTTRTKSKLEPLEYELRAIGGSVVGHAADFTIAQEVDALATALSADGGRLDGILLSSQPPSAQLGDLLTTPEALWQELHASIVWGPFRLLRALAPALMATGNVSIVSVVSTTALSPTPGLDAYGLAKGTLLLLTRYIAREWGHAGIRANAINPGSMITGDNAAELQEFATKTGLLERISLGRLGYTREFLALAVHLLSDESSFTSGQLINVDGGRF